MRRNNVTQNDKTNGDVNQNNDNVYVIEKILRKKKVQNKWRYRVKWLGYDANQNTWVEFEDLTPECQEYVKEIHHKIPTSK